MHSMIKPTLYASGLTVLWGFLAFANPTITYHLAPFLVAAAVPVGTALNESTSSATSGIAAATGLALALAAAAVLGMTEHLTGPSLLPAGGAVVETVVFGGVGAIGGLAYAIWHGR